MIRLFANINRAYGIGFGIAINSGRNMYSAGLLQLRITILFWEIVLGVEYTKRF